jgi:anti-anti-sigma factor
VGVVHFKVTDSLAPGGAAVVTVRGELDVATAAELARWLERASAVSPTVVLDLSGLTSMDESSVHAVATRCQELTRECRLRVIAREDAIAAAFERAGAAGLVEPDGRERVRARRFSP